MTLVKKIINSQKRKKRKKIRKNLKKINFINRYLNQLKIYLKLL